MDNQSNIPKSHTSDEVEYLLREADWWYLLDDGRFKASIQHGPSVFLTIDSLTDFHPLLPIALRAAILNINNGDTLEHSINGINALSTALILRDGIVNFTDIVGDKHSVTGFHDLMMPSSTSGPVVVLSSVVKLKYCKYSKQKVPYVIDGYRTLLALNQAELSKHFPGWHERYNIGLGLNFNNKTFLDYVFAKATSLDTAVSIVDSGFDYT